MMSAIIVLCVTTLLFLLSSRTKNLMQQVFYKLTGRKNVSISLFSLIIYPGVVVHELSHLLAAAVLLVPVKNISLVPEKTDQGIRSGSVTIAHTDPIRRTVVGIAPLIAGVIALWAVTVYLLPPISLICNNSTGFFAPLAQDDMLCAQSLSTLNSHISSFLALYLLFSISATMYSSRKDLEALKYSAPIVLGLISLMYIAGIRFAWAVETIRQFEALFQTIAGILIIPILIQLIMWLVLTGSIKLLK